MWLHLGKAECHVTVCDIDLISRIIVSVAYLIYYLREESQVCCMDTSLDAAVSHTILGHCDLDL